MLGTILFVDDATGTGIIRADDGKRYRFPVADWPAGPAIAAGVRVDFDTDGDRAVAPLPISDAVVTAVAAAPSLVDTAPSDASAEPVVAPPPISLGKPVSIEKAASPPLNPAPPLETPPIEPPAPEPTPPARIDVTDAAADDAGAPRPLAFGQDDVPDYVGATEVETKRGGISAIYIVGGVVLLLLLAALGYMMWDNAEMAGFTEGAPTESGATVSMFAQEDLPVRNVASMTNATVLGRIARGDRVSGVEVAGSADPQSRWLRLDGGNRFVPMTGLGTSAPPAVAAVPAAPPAIPPTVPGGGVLDGQPGNLDDGFGAAPPPVRPAPPQGRPAPVRPSPPPQRDIAPSRPQETRPVPPQRPIAPQRPSDPRDTQPVG